MSHTTVSPIAATSITREALLHFMRHMAEDTAQTNDHRDEPRLSVHAPVTLGVVLGTDHYRPLYSGWVTDISADGLSVLVEREVPLHMDLFIDLETLLGQSFIAPIRIVYCKRLLTYTYRLGAALRWRE